MGNNTSAPATRKSTAALRALSHHKQVERLEDEFNDKILHEVQPVQSNLNVPRSTLIPVKSDSKHTYDRFTDDLIEDEFNELNDGLIETDASEVSRNILPNNDSNNTSNNGPSDMEIDEPEREEASPAPDLSKVDFTKIAMPVATMEESYAVPHRHPHRGHNEIPVEIKWVNSTREDIHKISIIGSFSNWRDVIKLKPSRHHPNEFSTTIKLPLGVHKLLYIINNEYRVSEQLPTATDQEGIFFNWFEVIDNQHLFNHSQNQPNHIGALSDYDANIIQVAGKHDVEYIHHKSNTLLAKESKQTPDFEHIENPMDDIEHEEQTNYVSYNENLSSSFLNAAKKAEIDYSSTIPDMFVNYDYFKTKGPDYELPEPPQLPAHLNNVLLNKMSSSHQQNHAQNIPQYTPPVSQSMPEGFKPPTPTHTQEGLSSSGGANKRPALRRADSSYYASNKEAYHLSIPNHVILNHLMTTSIRNDVLTVACITRYSGKFVTQIMHSPADS